MSLNPIDTARAGTDTAAIEWQKPSFQVITLDCEITSYAADDGDEQPLF
jgi:hypothetical protein